MENDGFWKTAWRLRSMENDKRTGSGSKLFLFIESLTGLMNRRIGTEYVSIESGRDHEQEHIIYCYILEILQISLQFLILFRRHYGRNAKARPPSCPIFLPMDTNCKVNLSTLSVSKAEDSSVSHSTMNIISMADHNSISIHLYADLQHLSGKYRSLKNWVNIWAILNIVEIFKTFLKIFRKKLRYIKKKK